MAHHTSTTDDDAATTGNTGRWIRFQDWRRGRPFLGGVLLLLSGLAIAHVPLHFAAELLLVGGSFTFLGLVVASGVALCGLFALVRPDLSTIIGVVGVTLSILSIFGALGGLVVGMVLGIVGGNLCVAWQEPPREAVDRDDGGHGLASMLIEEDPGDDADTDIDL